MNYDDIVILNDSKNDIEQFFAETLEIFEKFHMKYVLKKPFFILLIVKFPSLKIGQQTSKRLIFKDSALQYIKSSQTKSKSLKIFGSLNSIQKCLKELPQFFSQIIWFVYLEILLSFGLPETKQYSIKFEIFTNTDRRAIISRGHQWC